MDLDLLAPKQVDWNKTYFQFLTELFFRRVGNRPKIKLEKFFFGIRPNCNIGTLELGLHQFCTRSNSEYQKIWVGPITKSLFPKKICKQFESGPTRFGSNPGTNSSSLELGLPGFKGVRIKPNSQFSSSELGLLSISEVRYSPIEKIMFRKQTY